MAISKYRRVGKSVCLEGYPDWPCVFRDSAASEKTIQMIVDSLNYCIDKGVLVESKTLDKSH